jgi:hypothetical protein
MEVQAQSRAPSRKPYPSDVTDEEWAFVVPYLALRPDARVVVAELMARVIDCNCNLD